MGPDFHQDDGITRGGFTPFSSFPRRREPILAGHGDTHADLRIWIPAFAGMTKGADQAVFIDAMSMTKRYFTSLFTIR